MIIGHGGNYSHADVCHKDIISNMINLMLKTNIFILIEKSKSNNLRDDIPGFKSDIPITVAINTS